MIYLASFSFVLMVFIIVNYFFNSLERKVITYISYDFRSRHGEKKVKRIYSGLYYLDLKGVYKYLSFKEGEVLKGRWKRLIPQGNLTKRVCKKEEEKHFVFNIYYLISDDNYYLNVSKHAYEHISYNSEIRSNWKSLYPDGSI